MPNDILQQVFGFNYAGFYRLLELTNMLSCSPEELHDNVNVLLLAYTKTHNSKRSEEELTKLLHAMIDEWFV